VSTINAILNNQSNHDNTISKGDLNFCWLDNENTAGNSSQVKALGKDEEHVIGPLCPDQFQQDMAPKDRARGGITVGMPYYGAPAMLLQQLSNFANYPAEIQDQLSIIIVDDGSPPGLQAGEYIGYFISTSAFHFRLQLARISTSIDWNVEGSRNLAFYLADTQRGVMLDLDMLVPVETMQEALRWNLTSIRLSNETQATQEVTVAHKFNRRTPNGKESFHHALAVLDINEYWRAGGLDEDFAGAYGFGTELHFWFVWKIGERVVENHANTFLLELDTDACDPNWIHSSDLLKKCKAARSKLPSLNKNKKPNRRLWKKKSQGRVSRSNSYLRFNWTIEMKI
jgi:hypothetical protein